MPSIPVRLGRVQLGAPSVVLGGQYSTTPAVAPLLLTATLKAALISPPSPASWVTIDPNRTQEMAPNYGT